VLPTLLMESLGSGRLNENRRGKDRLGLRLLGGRGPGRGVDDSTLLGSLPGRGGREQGLRVGGRRRRGIQDQQ